jgi:hypothetical protein
MEPDHVEVANDENLPICDQGPSLRQTIRDYGTSLNVAAAQLSKLISDTI